MTVANLVSIQSLLEFPCLSGGGENQYFFSHMLLHVNTVN